MVVSSDRRKVSQSGSQARKMFTHHVCRIYLVSTKPAELVWYRIVTEDHDGMGMKGWEVQWWERYGASEAAMGFAVQDEGFGYPMGMRQMVCVLSLRQAFPMMINTSLIQSSRWQIVIIRNVFRSPTQIESPSRRQENIVAP